MNWWTLAMLAYPETQARAQAELDAVIGRTRLPTFADYPHLPYIRAMVKELLRWRPIAPIITPHRSAQDDWYEGMFIPKGTICLANAWQMNRDPEIFGKNAEEFDPGRYLDASGDIAPGLTDLKKDGHFTYGFGSRICTGRVMADNTLFINIATILWAMKIERMRDLSGRLLPLDVDGWVDVGLIMLAGFLTYCHAGTNSRAPADVRSRSRPTSHHDFLTLLRCFHGNVSCGGYEREVVFGQTHGGKKLEQLNKFTANVLVGVERVERVERARCRSEMS